jgi:hypothetical protein
VRRGGLLAGCLIASAATQATAACFIQDTQVICGNGVVMNGAGVSILMGGRSLAPGTGDFVTPDGREVYLLPPGVQIGGSDRIERLPGAAGVPKPPAQ